MTTTRRKNTGRRVGTGVRDLNEYFLPPAPVEGDSRPQWAGPPW